MPVFEYRFLASLKALVHDLMQSKGSMAERYIAQEYITFCLRYFQGVETVFSRPQRNDTTNPNEDMYLFSMASQPKGKVEMGELDELSRKQAH